MKSKRVQHCALLDRIPTNWNYSYQSKIQIHYLQRQSQITKYSVSVVGLHTSASHIISLSAISKQIRRVNYYDTSRVADFKVSYFRSSSLQHVYKWCLVQVSLNFCKRSQIRPSSKINCSYQDNYPPLINIIT